MKKKRKYYKKETNTKKYGLFIFLILAIAVVGISFLGGIQLSVLGSETEKVINQKTIEMHLYPDSFTDYCVTRNCYSGSCSYMFICKRNGGYAGAAGGAYDAVTLYGGTRKIIGSFCTEQPIKKIYSISANVDAEDWFGTDVRTYPDFAFGLTDNSLKTNEETEVYYGSPFSYNTNYPNRDLGLNAAKITNFTKGKKCFDLYAIGGGFSSRTRYGMDITINHLNINYDAVECLDNDTQTKIQTDCNDYNESTTDLCFNYECQNVPKEIIIPPVVDLCGNNVCDMNEQTTCPSDCPVPPQLCGNGVCDAGESTSCIEDCIVTPPPTLCGNDVKDADETIFTCPKDYISTTWLVTLILLVGMIIYYLNIRK